MQCDGLSYEVALRKIQEAYARPAFRLDFPGRFFTTFLAFPPFSPGLPRLAFGFQPEKSFVLSLVFCFARLPPPPKEYLESRACRGICQR